MEFLQNVDLGTLLVLTVGGVLLCVVGVILFFGLQILGSTVGLLANFLDLFGNIAGGGPVAWCGCLVALVACVSCAGVLLLAGTCSANPASMNFCALFGR